MSDCQLRSTHPDKTVYTSGLGQDRSPPHTLGSLQGWCMQNTPEGTAGTGDPLVPAHVGKCQQDSETRIGKMASGIEILHTQCKHVGRCTWCKLDRRLDRLPRQCHCPRHRILPARKTSSSTASAVRLEMLAL